MKYLKKKITEIYKILLKKYDKQGWWPINNKYSPEYKKTEKTEKEKFEIIIGAILTQSTSWKSVEKALNNFRRIKSLNLKNIKKLSQGKLGELIKPAGYFNQKRKKINAFLNFLKKEKNKDLNKEISREELLNIWGIGPETADSILLYAYNKPVFVVDAYTRRIFKRLGLIEEKDYEKTREIFEKSFEEKKEKEKIQIFNEYHALIVEHAKQYCRKKPLCKECPLKNMCKFSSYSS